MAAKRRKRAKEFSGLRGHHVAFLTGDESHLENGFQWFALENLRAGKRSGSAGDQWTPESLIEKYGLPGDRQ